MMGVVTISVKSPMIDDQLQMLIADEDVRARIRDKFFRYGEYVDVRIDLDNLTATVVER